MKVIVDTSVWSLALRRKKQQEDPPVKTLKALISKGKVALLGAVRQELLSGIKHQEQFEKLKVSLHAFPNLVLDEGDYETAAEYFNLCRHHGIQGANTDFLICASAKRRNYEILTADKDFENFASYPNASQNTA